MEIRSYPFDPEQVRVPKGLFDPAWADPTVAARVALQTWRRVAGEPRNAAGLVPLLGPRPKNATTLARAVLPATRIAEAAGWVRGTAVNELHRRVAFGGGRSAYNFHAQVVTFAWDGAGGWCFRAHVGRFGGSAQDDATLSVEVGELGGAVLEARLSEENLLVEVRGQDPRLQAWRDEPLQLRFTFSVESREAETSTSERPGLEEALALFAP